MLLFNRILYSQTLFSFLLITGYCIASSGDFGTMDAQQQRKNVGRTWYVYYMLYVHFYIILYIPTTHHNSLLLYIFFFSLLLACGNDGVCFVYILLQMGWAYTFSWLFYPCSRFSVSFWCAHFNVDLGTALLASASYFDGFILLASYFDGCKFRKII
jgi:hypothetical protein